MSAAHCAHTRADGEPCRGYAITGSRFCVSHDPAQAAKRTDADSVGAAGRLPSVPGARRAIGISALAERAVLAAGRAQSDTGS